MKYDVKGEEMKYKAKGRYVNTRFWDDAYIATLAPMERYLFLYLLTNPLVEICGVYELKLPRIACDTGLDVSAIETMMLKLEGDGKVGYRFGWVAIANFARHQSAGSPDVQKGIARGLAAAPEWTREFVNYDVSADAPPDSAKAPVAAQAATADVPLAQEAKIPLADVKTVFAHWQTTLGKQLSKLDSKRTAQIRVRLQDFTVAQLCEAIDGVKKDSWLMGTEPKSTTSYLEFKTIFRDAEQIERLIGLAGTAGRVAAKNNVIQIPEQDWSRVPAMTRGPVFNDLARHKREIAN